MIFNWSLIILLKAINLSKIKPILENLYMSKKVKTILIFFISDIIANLFTELYLDNYNGKII